VEREGQFYSALASRDRIGQAEGILMERFNIDSVQAFEMLGVGVHLAGTPDLMAHLTPRSASALCV
jgi:hypothetical protein